MVLVVVQLHDLAADVRLERAVVVVEIGEAIDLIRHEDLSTRIVPEFTIGAGTKGMFPRMRIFEEFFKAEQGFTILARWGHVIAGVAWIGLLYFFNFVQTP